VAVKARGQFTVAGVPDVPARYCRLLQHGDGYVYARGSVVGQAPRGAMRAPSPNLSAVALMQATIDERGAQQSKKGERAFLPIPWTGRVPSAQTLWYRWRRLSRRR
jgi:hypothetical protein